MNPDVKGWMFVLLVVVCAFLLGIKIKYWWNERNQPDPLEPDMEFTETDISSWRMK